MDNDYNLPSDTPQSVMEMQISIVLQKTPLERLMMCCEMTDFSYEMLKRQIIARDNTISDNRLKFEIVKSLYSDCFSEEEMARIDKHFT
jgi:hypothetical protein